jgi:hypothetical protein
MIPKNLVLDEVRVPKDIDETVDLLETDFRVDHERTTLEALDMRPDGTVGTPAGQWLMTRDFLEACAQQIGMPLGYAYKISPELFCQNFGQRRVETTTPVTISRVGGVATGLIDDQKARYRPARTVDVLRAVCSLHDLEFRRAVVSFAGVDVELVRPGVVVEPAVGDVIEAGIAITNSESGDRHLKASAYSYRLLCTNGARMADSLGVARWPNDPRMTDAGCLRSLLQELGGLWGKLDSVVRLYETVSHRLIPAAELWNLWRRVAFVVPRTEADLVLGLSAAERQELQQRIRTGNAQEASLPTTRNAYEVHNRITYAGHRGSFRARRALQEIGGALLSRAAEWPPTASAN